MFTDDWAGDWAGPGQDHGPVPIPPGKRRLRALLQAAPGQEAAAQQERLGWLGEEHDIQTEGTLSCIVVN